MTCAALESIAAWVQGELSEVDSDAFEEHFFGCDACTSNARRLLRLVGQLASALPPVLTPERRRALGARHPRLPAVDVEPGQRRQLRIGETQPVGVWLIRAPLAGATRVDLEASAGGTRLFYLADVPFDAMRGEVVLACQAHYSALPPVLEVTLRASGPDGPRPATEYILDHDFENP
jgi:anti-sigma factor RsiW